MPAPPPVYPVALVVAGRPCLVVGGRDPARRKVEGLLAAQAAVTVVAPHVDPALADLVGVAGAAPHTATTDQLLGGPGGVPDRPLPAGVTRGILAIERRRYAPGEAAAYRLVVTATGRPEVDGAVSRDAEAAGVWVNAVDDPAHCSVLLPSVHRDGPIAIAVSTGGTSPALASWLRRRLAREAWPGIGTLAVLLEEARSAVQASGRPTGSVDWAALLDGPLPGLVREGRTAEARAILQRVTGSGAAHHEDEGDDQ